MTEAPADIIVYPSDVLACGICLIPGTRGFFADAGLDFRDFIRNGIAASKLTALNDTLADRVVAKAMERTRG